MEAWKCCAVRNSPSVQFTGRCCMRNREPSGPPLFNQNPRDTTLSHPFRPFNLTFFHEPFYAGAHSNQRCRAALVAGQEVAIMLTIEAFATSFRSGNAVEVGT